MKYSHVSIEQWERDEAGNSRHGKATAAIFKAIKLLLATALWLSPPATSQLFQKDYPSSDVNNPHTFLLAGNYMPVDLSVGLLCGSGQWVIASSAIMEFPRGWLLMRGDGGWCGVMARPLGVTSLRTRAWWCIEAASEVLITDTYGSLGWSAKLHCAMAMCHGNVEWQCGMTMWNGMMLCACLLTTALQPQSLVYWALSCNWRCIW